MADLANMSDQFKGLPMDSLIGGPLQAAVNANVMMAQSTADFINTVGFDQIPEDPNDTSKGMKAGKARTAQFKFQQKFQRQIRPVQCRGQGRVGTVLRLGQSKRLLLQPQGEHPLFRQFRQVSCRGESEELRHSRRACPGP